MTKKSPDGNHLAKLTRVTGIDVNFRVYLDGDRIYGSPDFAPVRFDFREQIMWDTTGQLLILEVAGKRIFGYHVTQRRSLRDDEISAAELPPFQDYRYEGTLPKAAFLNSTVTPTLSLQRIAPQSLSLGSIQDYPPYGLSAADARP